MNNYWRFIPLMRASGAVQMAIDRWLLQQHRFYEHPPVLRFYTWSPVAISLGYHQRHYPDRWHQLSWKEKPVELVRRPTGGRAVLHQGDLTYTVVTSDFAGNRVQVYEKLCQFLIEGWRSLGVELQYGRAGRGYIHNPNCFMTATNADLITTEGHKLIGSAQLRQATAILQQGSMLLNPDEHLFLQVFEQWTPQKLKLPFVDREEELQNLIIQALTEAAQRCFGVELVTEPLLEFEWEQINLLDIQLSR